MTPRRANQMQNVSIRISEDAWDQIKAEADLAGVSASEFIREAVFFRLGYRWAARMDDDDLARRLERLGVLRRPY